MIRIGARGRVVGTTALAVVIVAVVVSVGCLPSAPSPSNVQASYRPSEALLLDRHGETLDAERLDFGVRRLEWVTLDAVSPSLVAEVVNGEDHRFWQHGGVDWRAVGAALRDRLVSQRRRGASTITMQLASLIAGRRPGATSTGAWRRKIAQVRMAWALEAHWTKAEILEAYLNLLEFRGELQGIGAAAHVLAGKSPAGLSQSESLVLAALLPNPDAAPAGVAARACHRGAARHLSVSCVELQAMATALLSRGAAIPRADRLAPQLAHVFLTVPGTRVHTTIDLVTQRLAKDVLSRHLADLSSHNVRDGAVLVVDNESGDVLAYVGSAGSLSNASQVDGVRAHRQAGSTLKPFLYELALERRYLTAASLLEDSPVNLDTATGAYIPQDYDHDFKGLVSVRTALGSSLNVPAVRALVIVGVEPFRTRLHDLGYEAIRESGEFYGYSLALGSAEVSLWEQAQAYRILARGGRYAPLRLRLNDTVQSERQVFPADAAYIATDILADRAARVVTFGLDNHLNTSFWSAAKTGTSKDMRDNWCIGFSRKYTVAVWVGNFEGDSMHDVSGVTGAAPVWRDLMDALHGSSISTAPPVPASVMQVQTRFTPAVEPTRHEWFLEGTEIQTVAAITKAGEVPRIASPANGMIIAIDPDIPAQQQRVPLTVAGPTAGMLLRLNGKLLWGASQAVLWSPERGAHRLALEDRGGRTVDSILFTVR